MRIEFQLKLTLLGRSGQSPLDLVKAQRVVLQPTMAALDGTPAQPPDHVELWRQHNAAAADAYLRGPGEHLSEGGKIMKLRVWWLIAVSTSLMLLATPALASELPDDWRNEVTDYVTGRWQDIDAPGAAIVIVDGDEVLYAEGLGVAGPGGDPVTPETPFHLASVSKAITGLAVMQLVEGGRWTLTPLSEGPASGSVGIIFPRRK